MIKHLFLLTVLFFTTPLFSDEIAAPIYCGDNLPFQVKVQRDFILPKGLHSFAHATYQGKWILIGGSHEWAMQNTSIFIVDPIKKSCNLRNLNDSDLNPLYISKISNSSLKFCQIDDILYVEDNFVNAIFEIHLPTVIKWAENHPEHKLSSAIYPIARKKLKRGASFKKITCEDFVSTNLRNFSERIDYNIAFGGTNYGYFVEGLYSLDYKFPFVNSIIISAQDSTGFLTKYLMDDTYPVILSEDFNAGCPLLFGEGAAFIPAEGTVKDFLGKIIYDDLPHQSVIGYIVGGVQNTLSEVKTPPSSNHVFKVTLQKK